MQMSTAEMVYAFFSPSQIYFRVVHRILKVHTGVFFFYLRLTYNYV